MSYGRWPDYATWADEVEAAWTPTIDELRSARIAAEIEHVGGGCVCLRVPLSEDGTRYVRFGTDDDPIEPLWIDERGPLGWLSGCGYIADDDGVNLAWCEIEPAAVGVDFLAAVRAALLDVMARPESEYQPA